MLDLASGWWLLTRIVAMSASPCLSGRAVGRLPGRRTESKSPSPPAAQGVELTPQQKQRVNGIGQEHQAALQEYGKQGVTWSSVTAAQVEFEQRLTSALMLQQNLVATEAHVAPALNAGAQAQYEQARSELLARFKVEANISVSAAEL